MRTGNHHDGQKHFQPKEQDGEDNEIEESLVCRTQRICSVGVNVVNKGKIAIGKASHTELEG